MSDSSRKDFLKEHFLHKILNPSSIAIFGANNNLLTTMGSMQLRNIVAGGFNGEIYPIHPRLNKVQGFKAYRNVLDLPEIPDLAFIILPPEIVPEVLEECGQKGIKGAIITSGGFREVGEDGKELSDKVNNLAKKYGIRFIGPNCLGIFNNWYNPDIRNSHFNTMWIYQVPERGQTSIISQSGTIACHTFWHAKDWGVKIGKSISIGNELNIDLVDLLKYFKEDPQTNVIGLYIEEIKRGDEFIEITKEITPKKPIIAIYAGGSEAAERSIKSHTGAMGGNQNIYDGIFKQTGIISTESITDFLYYLRTFDFAQKFDVYPKGKKLGVITDSGGSGSMMVKSAEKLGLHVPKFSTTLQEEIRQYIPPTASSLNPIDVTFDIDFVNMFIKFPKILMKSGEVDSIIIYGVFDLDDVMKIMESSGMEFDENMKQIGTLIEGAVMKPIKRLMKKYSIPVFYVGPYPYRYPWFQKFLGQEIPIFDFWDQPTKCLKILSDYQKFRENIEI
ncbi:MAG: CoA-binding protein [Candidatus Lokiarchaeota archaeon]